MNEQSHYKQDKTITRQSINVKRHIFNVIGDTEKFKERDLNIGGDCGMLKLDLVEMTSQEDAGSISGSNSLKEFLYLTQKGFHKAMTDVFESDIKGSTAFTSSPQNVAFVSENTSSTNEVSTAYCVPNPSGQNSKEYKIKGTQDNKRRDAWNSGNKDGSRTGQKEDSKALVTIDGEAQDSGPGVVLFAPIIEEYDSDSEVEYVSIPIKSAETHSFATTCNLNHLIRDCDFHEKRMARKANLNSGWNKKTSQKELRETWNNVQRVNKQNQFVPSAVLTRTDRQTTSTAMKVNTVKPTVNRVRPANVFHKTHSPYTRPFKKTTVLRTVVTNQKLNTAKVNAVSTVGGQRETAVKSSAGRSGPNRLGHMTGNKAYLAEFQDFNGGLVAFGGSKGYITGKGMLLNSMGQKGSRGNIAMQELHNKMELLKERTGPLLRLLGPCLQKIILPNTFWAEADSMLVMSKQGCHGEHLDTINHLGKSEISSYHHAVPQEDYQNADEKRDGPREEKQVFLEELERLKRQEKEANEEAEALRKEFEQETENLVLKEGAARASSTNIFSTVSTPAKASSTNLVNTVSTPFSTASPHEGLTLSDPTNPEQDDSEIPPLEDIYQNSSDGIFTTSSYDDEGAEAISQYLEFVVYCYPIPTSRIYSLSSTASYSWRSNLRIQN
ncbi:hypothetical protein Tco_1371130 [Tanacetum coccineum]